MKSIIFNLLLCLFPFVAFSSTFTSTDNPIVLPTTTTTTTVTTDDNDNGILFPEVLDRDGQPLKTDEEYVIFNNLYGGGAIYLANVLSTTCPNGVVLDSSGDFEKGTPVKFFAKQPFNHVVREMDYINIMFSVSSKPCVNETVWKVDAPKPGGIRFLVTGGTLGNPGRDTINNWFKIEKLITTRSGYQYRLRHCPVQFLCPPCLINDCRDVGAKFDRGYHRLALTDQPIPFGFEKVRKNGA